MKPAAAAPMDALEYLAKKEREMARKAGSARLRKSVGQTCRVSYTSRPGALTCSCGLCLTMRQKSEAAPAPVREPLRLNVIYDGRTAIDRAEDAHRARDRVRNDASDRSGRAGRATTSHPSLRRLVA